MDLQERLQNLASLGLLKTERKAKPPKDSFLAEYLNGKIISNSVGEYVQLHKTYGTTYRHGNVCLSDLTSVDGKTVCFLSATQNLQRFDVRRTIFLDTETTGLAGGSGTYPFLVGIGYFESDKFVLRQYFMRDYGEEKALLHDLSKHLENYPFIVTYNGKGYDLPILKTRYILNRIKSSLEFDGHLDLLFPARRIWKQRVKDCRLSNLENKILGVERELDIPSYLIPQAYFEFLRSGENEKIKLIMEHNANDIVSMAALLAHLCQLLENPDKLEGIYPEDLFSLGKSFYYSEQYDRACWCLEKAADKSSSEELFLQSHRYLGRLFKRTGEWQKAENTWQKVVKDYNRFCLEPYLELAKLYEHRARNYSRALALVEKAIDNLNASINNQMNYGLEQSLYYRKQRLLRKLGRKA
jgi:uncharacterized protein YprB with RNaseH-like and TPR domain